MSTVGSYRGPNIVTRGLVLHLDAASPNSYYSPNGGTVWKDVSGNGNNGILTNGPTFSSDNEGTFVFDGSNDNINVGSPAITNMNTGDFSIECVFKAEGDSDYRVVLQKGNPGIGSNRGYRLRVENTDRIQLTVTGDTERTATTGFITYGEYYHVIAIKENNSTLKVYVNNVLSEGQTTPQGTTTVTDDLVIGIQDGGLWPFSGNIPLCRIYNRALSAQEVLQNYNATKDRFGL